VRDSYDFEWFKVRRLPRYGWVVVRSPAVVVLAIAPDDRLWLERLARVPTRTTSWELPGGGVQRGEDVLSAGLRELEEECGLVPRRAYRLPGHFEPIPGMGSIPHHVIVAVDAVPRATRAVGQKSEGILAVRKFDRAAVHKMVLNGRISVMATLGPLLSSGWLQGTLRRERRSG
jgi:8-oxo-dGTP pyrophosphatase MutT (NUDIX family)